MAEATVTLAAPGIRIEDSSTPVTPPQRFKRTLSKEAETTDFINSVHMAANDSITREIPRSEAVAIIERSTQAGNGARQAIEFDPRLPSHAMTMPPSPVSPSIKPSGLQDASKDQPSQIDGAFDRSRFGRPARPQEDTTSPGRRSVQFARSPTGVDQLDFAALPSVLPANEGSLDSPPRDRRGFTLLSKLKALAVPSGLPGHSRSQSGYTLGDESADEGTTPQPLSPAINREAVQLPLRSVHALGEVEEDSQDSGGDLEARPAGERASSSYFGHRRHRRDRRRSDEGPNTAPTASRRPGFLNRERGESSPVLDHTIQGRRPLNLRRRATITNIEEDRRAGVSEDEGRQRLAKESPWMPGFWTKGSSQGESENRRPSNFRRLTTWAGGSENGPNATPSSRRRALESNLSMSAARWRALKAGLKMMGQKRKEDHRFDQSKSAELLAELAAGTPAVLIVASMFQRDDHGNKRIPVLLEQLKVRLTDSRRVDGKTVGDRHQIFRIELEYGSGLTRMKWVIHRSLRDFTNLHVRYKLQSSSDKYKHFHGREDSSRQKIPRFPRTAFPFLRGARGLGSEDEDDGDDAEDDTGASGNDGTATRHEKRPRSKKKTLLPGNRRRGSLPARLSSYDDAPANQVDLQHGDVGVSGTSGGRREPYSERQRKKLEQYLQQMIRHLMFRADSSRLCKFLELSLLGIRLAAEGGYHGKEGFLMIQSAKGLDFRAALNATLGFNRQALKWFLVRHSYVVCVDSPEEMNIYDVFLVDEKFGFECKRGRFREMKKSRIPKQIALGAKQSATRTQHHTLKLRNSERKLRLLAKNERQLLQFEESINFMIKNTLWSNPHRFKSFAPVRTGVFAQWLVDGRDYMWNVSRAISMARDVVYIHGWWLSPELYMRRPAAISRKWRLDRLLQRKASEGVKIFVILYRNINSAIPIDSSYTKFSLLDLHPNVFVQRSPNQFRQNTFFWAHHEKICIVDHTVAFVGGIDLCFGRWDTPQHSVTDDKLTGFEQSDFPKDADHCQLWPGKDYSNPRVQDFYALDKPYEEMYDRTNVPRMPWHDISMQVVGQPARDLTRHFVQRWNYVLRHRKPTRPTPFLLPPPDFNPADLEALGLDGTCEVQILRSCSPWSIGTPDKIEHSILTAYIKTIEQSEHFVYIENQFFISSCKVEGTVIDNMIGEALVNRVVRAAANGESWRAVILIPLMPGFQNTVDSQDGTSIRLIMQCQYRSICRGETSIFGKLHAQGIEPEDYIQFYSLRSWGMIGPAKMLTTEQLYIHAKCMIVDDRIAIIGSANINERSMRGDRDSECAAIVRDTDMIWSCMNGEPYLVGRFPHTLRMRLMREHLGVDVDEVLEEETEHDNNRPRSKGGSGSSRRRGSNSSSRQTASVDNDAEKAIIESRHRVQDELIAKSENIYSFNHDCEWEQANNPNTRTDRKKTEDKRVTGNLEHRQDVEGRGADHMLEGPDPVVDRGRDSAVVGGGREVLVVDVAPEGKDALFAVNIDVPNLPEGKKGNDVEDDVSQDTSLQVLSHSQTDATKATPRSPQSATAPTGEPAEAEKTQAPQDFVSSLAADVKCPTVEPDCMRDPLSDSFYHGIWHTVAENNTKLFRYVFRCMPDSEVQNWKKYKEYVAFGERFAQSQGAAKSKMRAQQESTGKSGPPGAANLVEKLAGLEPIGETFHGINKKLGNLSEKTANEKSALISLDSIDEWANEANRAQHERDEQTRSTKKLDQGGGDEIKSPDPSRLDLVDEKAAAKAASATDEPVDGLTAANGDMMLKTMPDDSGQVDVEKAPSRYSPIQSQITGTDTVSKNSSSQRRRRRGTLRSSRREFLASDDLMEKAEAEELMNLVQGHLVLWPYDWLLREEEGGNWLYNIDQLAPLEIYN